MWQHHCWRSAPRFVPLGKFSHNFSSSSFVIRVNPLHPWPSPCFFMDYCYLVFFYQRKLLFSGILQFKGQATQNTVIELLSLKSNLLFYRYATDVPKESHFYTCFSLFLSFPSPTSGFPKYGLHYHNGRFRLILPRTSEATPFTRNEFTRQNIKMER